MRRLRPTCLDFLAIPTALAALFSIAIPTRAQSPAAPNPAPQSSAPQTSPSGMPAWQKAAGGHLEFDVASVKEDPPDASGQRVMPASNVPLAPGDTFSPTGGLFQATHWPLIVYISFAYKLLPGQLQSLNSNLPKWTMQDFFDVQARSAGNPTKDQFRLMMQSLLADRFKLAIHTETREQPVFALVLDKPGKFGPQLRAHTDDSPACAPATAASALPFTTSTVDAGYPAECGSVMMIPTDKRASVGVGGRNVTMALIASTIDTAGQLIGELGRPVIDGTGLTGTFDFRIDFAPQLPFMPNPAADQSAPTFLEALKDQLGLKLDSQTGEVQEIVVDHVDHPTLN
ncbi:MAG TPA: TIGR03435 family protein [Candidatus Acidoferrales bacterium]|nr:TIGR03435 family protein [Candidatus Acidoferrales bacterium]